MKDVALRVRGTLTVTLQQVNTPWFPRADGAFIAGPPQQQLLSGPISNIPFVNGTWKSAPWTRRLFKQIIVGNDKDEGTAFSFPTLNLT